MHRHKNWRCRIKTTHTRYKCIPSVASSAQLLVVAAAAVTPCKGQPGASCGHGQGRVLVHGTWRLARSCLGDVPAPALSERRSAICCDCVGPVITSSARRARHHPAAVISSSSRHAAPLLIQDSSLRACGWMHAVLHASGAQAQLRARRLKSCISSGPSSGSIGLVAQARDLTLGSDDRWQSAADPATGGNSVGESVQPCSPVVA